jgi:hypothetical protein
MDEKTIRLECLKLAIAHYPDRQPVEVVGRAGEFEKFVAGSDRPGSTLGLPKKADNPAHRGR